MAKTGPDSKDSKAYAILRKRYALSRKSRYHRREQTSCFEDAGFVNFFLPQIVANYDSESKCEESLQIQYLACAP